VTYFIAALSSGSSNSCCNSIIVVTMTIKVNGKTQNLTPCGSETLKNIETKITN